MDCKVCKFNEIDFVWDGEDEELIHYCSKRHKLNFLFQKGCKDYQEYIPQPYIEHFTECDKCKYLSECKSVVDITILEDEHRHFIRGMGGYCKKGNSEKS